MPGARRHCRYSAVYGRKPYHWRYGSGTGSVDVIAPLMIPAVLPFNLIKTVLNSVLTLAVYKAVSNLITPKKDQVKGRA